MTDTTEELAPFALSEDAFRRVMAVGCNDCEWTLVLRVYRSARRRQRRTGMMAVSNHSKTTGHTNTWSAEGHM